MKNDPRELQQVAAAAQPRFDMYAGIHKALRAMMAETLVGLGRMDVHDSAEVGRHAERVQSLLSFCASHLRHENEFVHRAMEARAPGASAAVAHDHVEHEQHIAHLSQAARAVAAAPSPAGALGLYRDVSAFVADNFLHMLVEETAHNAVLWAHYTDAELVDIHDALVASIPPQEMMVTARWMLPAMNPAERLAVLADMRAHAPAPAFQAVLDTIQPHLQPGEWSKLARALGLAPVPGLVQA